MDDNSGQWEPQHGGFLAALHLLEASAPDSPASSAHAFRQRVLVLAETHLEHHEPRVRKTVAELLEKLSKIDGASVYEHIRPTLLSSIAENFERQHVDAAVEASAAEVAAAGDPEDDPTSLFRPKSMKNPSIAELKHDTEGWKSLETSFEALEKIMQGCGSRFSPYVTDELLDMIFKSVSHRNRFVRETAYKACGTIAQICEEDKMAEICDRYTTIVVRGLGDNWSQVRWAASIAVRSFFTHAAESLREQYTGRLIAPMALNRLYVAAGVRNYSQQTWRQAFGERGAELVAKHIDNVVEYYCKQAVADNHAVREAACHCIAELATKVDHAAVRPHVPKLLDALLLCFRDESWPVRDASCVACGLFVGGFPDESRPALDDLYELWLSHLADNIPSVREDSAVALGRVLQAYGDEALDRVLPHVKKSLVSVKDQPAESKKYGDLTNTTVFGVAAKKARDNDPDLHTGRVMYSCGSLAPKLRRATGCMDHGFHRDPEPWEATDGAVHMLAELAAFRAELVVDLLPVLAEIADVRHFAHYTQLQQTIWTQVPNIAKSMGKKLFKRNMQQLLDPLIKTLRCDNRLAENAAGLCVGELGKLVGKLIFRGRLEPDQLDIIDRSPFVDEYMKGE